MNKLKKVDKIKARLINSREDVWQLYSLVNTNSPSNTLMYIYNNSINIIYFDEKDSSINLARSDKSGLNFNIYSVIKDLYIEDSLDIAVYKNYSYISYIRFKDFSQSLNILVIDNEKGEAINLEIPEDRFMPVGKTAIEADSKGNLYLSFYDGLKKEFYIAEFKDCSNINELSNWDKWIFIKLDIEIGDISAIKFGKDDRLHIVYANLKNGEKKILYLNKPKVRFSRAVVVDRGDDAGSYLDIVEYDKKPFILYYKGANLYVAYKDRLKWKIEVIDDNTLVGKYIRAFSDKQGIYVSYKDFKFGDLKFACFDGKKWNIDFVESKGDIGQGSFIIKNNSKIYISYLDSTQNLLKLAIKKL